MSPPSLTRRQQQIFEFLQEHAGSFPHPPTLDELCAALGLQSRGSMHKHIQALIRAGLVEPMEGRHRGIRIVPRAEEALAQLPLLGRIAAGAPIEAISDPQTVTVPRRLCSDGDCYVLEVRGDSMVEAGILDGDWIVVERRETARSGEIVVALIDGSEATLKRLETVGDQVLLHPANGAFETRRYDAGRVRVQGVLVGQMRTYLR